MKKIRKHWIIYLLVLVGIAVPTALYAGKCDTDCESCDQSDEYECGSYCKYYDWRTGQKDCESSLVWDDHCLDQAICDDIEKYRDRSSWSCSWQGEGYYGEVSGEGSYCGDSPCGEGSGYFSAAVTGSCVCSAYGDWTIHCGYQKCNGEGPGACSGCTYSVANCSGSDCD